jgi:uncharacterized membrane protein
VVEAQYVPLQKNLIHVASLKRAAVEVIMKNIQTTHRKTLYLVQLAMLTAILLILNFTPIGFLKIGLVEITFMAIPFVIGGVVLGPFTGAFLGLVFGLCSLSLAPAHPLFGVVFTENPLLMAAICIIPRILVGLSAAYIARLAIKMGKYEKLSYFAAGLIGSLVNTVLFLGGVVIFLQNYISPKMAEFGLLSAKTFIGFWVSIGVINGIPEAIVCTMLSAAVIIPLKTMLKRFS